MNIIALLPIIKSVKDYFWQSGKLNTITAVGATVGAYEFAPEIVQLIEVVFSKEVAEIGADGGISAIIAGGLVLLRLIAGWLENKK